MILEEAVVEKNKYDEKIKLLSTMKVGSDAIYTYSLIGSVKLSLPN